jgi:hypothetical protein
MAEVARMSVVSTKQAENAEVELTDSDAPVTPHTREGCGFRAERRLQCSTTIPQPLSSLNP